MVPAILCANWEYQAKLFFRERERFVQGTEKVDFGSCLFGNLLLDIIVGVFDKCAGNSVSWPMQPKFWEKYSSTFLVCN